MKIDALVVELFSNLDYLWTFLLLLSRYTGLFLILPGIGQGITGLKVRIPAIFAITLASMASSRLAAVPDNIVLLIISFFTEVCFGFLLGLIPYFIVAGVQSGAQLATNTMGLSTTQLFDPTIGASSTDLAKIQGDLVVIMFLFIGGHHLVIQAAAGLSNSFTPGNFIFDQPTAEFMVDRVHDVLRSGVMIASPVLVALLLTQFVMGIISKAVPTVNIFIVSFPLTIGIGLVLSFLAIPEMLQYIGNEYSSIENQISIVIENTTDFKIQ